MCYLLLLLYFNAFIYGKLSQVHLYDINKVLVYHSGITRFAIPAMKDSEKSRTDPTRLDTSHKLFGMNESIVLGIGRAEIKQNGMNCAYIVGRYKPAGNFGGSYRVNVLKGSFNRDVYCPTAVKKMSTEHLSVQKKAR